jgi:hypothetical protein
MPENRIVAFKASLMLATSRPAVGVGEAMGFAVERRAFELRLPAGPEREATVGRMRLTAARSRLPRSPLDLECLLRTDEPNGNLAIGRHARPEDDRLSRDRSG